MLTTYLRSSIYSSYDICEHKTFLTYFLGLKEDGNKKAELGNVMHKVCECLAAAKLKHQQTGKIGGFNVGDEYIGKIRPKNIFDDSMIDTLCKMSHDYHSSISIHDWTDEDCVMVREWLQKIITLQNGAFDPRKKQVAHVEKYFDFQIDQDWARYEYDVGGKKIEGQLALKGTVDLIMEVDSDHYEVLDYKSGKRLNWATGEEKTYDYLQTDPQLLIYYYACRKIFPDIKHFDFTIYYINHGGPFTMSFDDYHYHLAEELIKERFLEMKKNQYPKLLSKTRSDFRCKYLCDFAKKNYPGTEISICEYFHNKVKESSADGVLANYADLSKIGEYGDGGGRKSESATN